MINNTTIIRTPLLTLLFIAILLFSLSADAVCRKNTAGTAVVINDLVVGDGQRPVTSLADEEFNVDTPTDACSDTPDSYQIKFYKMGLCTASPAGNDLSSCSFMLDNDAGVDHEINFPATGVLDIPEFTMPPATYTHMVAVISNKLGIKDTRNFVDEAGNPRQVAGVAASLGATCWTTGGAGTTSTISNDLITSAPHAITTAGPGDILITCGAQNAADPKFNYEIIANLQEEVINNNGECLIAPFGPTDYFTFPVAGDPDPTPFVLPGGGGQSAQASVLQANGDLATNCGNSAKLLYTITMAEPITTSSTSTFTLNMKTKNAVSIDFSSTVVVTNQAEISKMGADPIQVFLDVETPSPI